MSTNKKKILLVIFILLISLLAFKVYADPAQEVGYVGENFCSEDSVKRLLVIAGYILIFAKILIPLIIIIKGSFDVFQAVITKDNKIVASIKTLAFRIFLGIFIFFIPSLVKWTVGLFPNDNNQCFDCVLSPTECR